MSDHITCPHCGATIFSVSLGQQDVDDESANFSGSCRKCNCTFTLQFIDPVFELLTAGSEGMSDD